MKKVIWLISGGVLILIAGVILLIALTAKPPVLLPSSTISFEIEEENLFSGKKSDGTYDEYMLTIYCKDQTLLVNPTLTFSNHIEKTSFVEFEDKIIMHFHIKFGTSFSFELKTNNIETAKKSFHCTQYVQKITVDFVNLISNSEEYELEIEDEKYVLYYINSSSQINQSVEDKFPAILRYQTAVGVGETNNFEVSSSGYALQVDEDNKTIKVMGVATNVKITFTATDGSGFTHTIPFKIKTPIARDVAGLPSSISLDLFSNPILTLPASPLPSYADFDFYITCASDHITISGLSITAKRVGSTFLQCYLNGNIYTTIQISISNTIPSAEFDISFPDANIPFENSTAHITLTGSYVEFILEVEIIDEELNHYSSDIAITTDLNYEKLANNQIYFLATQTGQYTITFTNSTFDIEQTITIIIE